MSRKGINGFGAEASGSGSRASAVTRNGTRGSARFGFSGAAAADGSGKAMYRASRPDEPVEVTAEMLDAERGTLLVENQARLDGTIDKHDDMVREMFHLENFKNMLLYNPKEAKNDNTAVFREYKARYDLVDNTAPIAGPSRQTRGRLNERRQILKSTTISAPLPATSPIKRKPKPKTADKPDLENILASARSYKGKGKEKDDLPHAGAAAHVAGEPGAEAPVPVESASAPVIEEWPSTIVVRRKPDRRGLAPTSAPPIIAHGIDNLVEPVSAPAPSQEESVSVRESPRRKPNGNVRTQNLKRTASVSVDVLEQLEKSAGNVSTNGTSEVLVCPPPPPPDESISIGIVRRSGRLREPPAPKPSPKPVIKLTVRPPVDDTLLPPATPPPSDIAPPPPYSSPIKLSIKRIKLIVRRPPPTLTNPRQRAPKPKFNSSLHQFLTSYINLDEHDAQASALQQEAKEEAEIRERIQRFRTEGRFIPGTDVLFGTESHIPPYTSPKRTTKDIWDDIVEAVIARAKTRPKKSVGRQIAAQIASKVQAYFDAQQSKKIKAKEAEERRLRNLAKSTMKLVIAEWKKAVYHIREKQRLELEAEERRLGHAHLDAILDQSGQILETQQGDLSRGDLYGSRSRSGSIGDFGDEEDNDEEDEDEEDVSDEEEEEEAGEEVDDEDLEHRTSTSLHSGHDEEDEDAEDGGESTSALLGNLLTRSHSSPPTRSETPEAIPSEGREDDDDPEASTTHLLNGNSTLDDLVMYSDSSSEADLGDLMHPDPESSPQRPPLPSLARLKDDQAEEETEAQPTSFSASFEVEETAELSVETRTTSRSRSTSPAADVGLSRSRSRSREVRFSVPNSSDMEDERAVETPNDLDESQSQVDKDVSAEPADTPMEVEEDHEEKEQDSEKEGEPRKAGEQEKEVTDIESQIPDYLKPYAVAPVEWDPDAKVTPPLLLRGVLRPYQQSGLEWLASLHINRLNGILADEMGLGKTIQTIALLAHLACDRGIWGPHLIVVPTSVLLNWEMEFKKFLPGFRILSYHGTTKRRKELRQGWNDKHHFNVCITSYTLASRDAHIFKRKAWYYMILDEAHMIKNFKSQRWNILLMFRSYRRLLLTGTPLQNNLTELWALLQFLMSGANFANLKEFGEWFSNPLEKAIEMGTALNDDTMQTVSKLHTVLRPYLLRRLKRDVEKELPSKFEHLTMCPLSKRQRFLYDEFMSRAQTRDALDSGVYQKIANILMQLRKVCNHPDLFEVRPIVTSFAMARSAIADFEIKELLVRRRLLSDDETVSLDVVGLSFIDRQNVSLLTAVETRRLDATTKLPYFSETAGEPPPKDTRTISGYRKYSAYAKRAGTIARWAHVGYLNRLRCSRIPIYSEEALSVVRRMSSSIVPFSDINPRIDYLERVDRVNQAVKSYTTRAQEMASLVDRFAFITPPVVAWDLPHIALSGYEDEILQQPLDFDEVLHPACVKLQIAFPDPSLLQYDCGKLQKLANLLREKKAGGHRILIFTQMTRILDILETFLNFHGYLYLRLDGATKIEDRQYITERFNADPRIFCFIASSRSGGVGINLTGADTVIFYDSDFNPQMDRQCEDRAHRIGQIRDVHIYRFVSQYTVEEAMLRKANQKRSLDDLVIQKGEFDWRTLFSDETALTKALGDFEDAEDRHAAAVAAREEISLVGADEADFGGGDAEAGPETGGGPGLSTPADDLGDVDLAGGEVDEGGAEDEDQDEQGGSVVEYMLRFVEEDYDYFREWRL